MGEQQACRVLADITGADIVQIMDADKRTREQSVMIELLSAIDQSVIPQVTNILRIVYASAKELDRIGERDPQSDNALTPFAVIFFLLECNIRLSQNAETLEKYEQYISDKVKDGDLSVSAIVDHFFSQKRDEALKGLEELISDQLKNGVTSVSAASITVRSLKYVDLVLDKLNSTIWGLPDSAIGKRLPIKAEKNGSKKELSIIYSINFDDLEGVSISKNLTPFDKNLYCRCADLYRAGYDRFTLKQLYNAMGHTGTPGANDKKRINESIQKMNGAKVRVDNSEEAAIYHYDTFRYWGSLLPAEGCEVIANGQLAEDAVHLLAEPPLVRFARQRGQITTIKADLLSMPLSSTDENLHIQDYLLVRIARARSGSMPRKILYETIYEELNTKRDRKRVRDKVEKLMDFFVEKGHIKSYTKSEKAIEIEL